MSKNPQPNKPNLPNNSFVQWYNQFLSQVKFSQKSSSLTEAKNSKDGRIKSSQPLEKGYGSSFFFPFGSTGNSNLGKNKNSKTLENSKQQAVSITYEEIGLFPRSFNRVFDRFFKQLFFDVENLVIQEYRFYRYLFLTTVKCLFILITVPLMVNFVSKHYVIRPLTEYYWNSRQPEIFLNSYMQRRAFNELKDFEEKVYFESLIMPGNTPNYLQTPGTDSSSHLLTKEPAKLTSPTKIKQRNFEPTTTLNSESQESTNSVSGKNVEKSDMESSRFQLQFNQYVQQVLQKKTVELALHYNEESIEAITNFFADLVSFGTLGLLVLNLEIQINITKSFLLEVFFGLDDSKKSLFILFVTDLLVGYHSPNIWELFFSSLFDHYGLPENQTTIFLLVATLPVLLDVLFKYLIFRHLNRASPATVATYHAMIE